MKFLPLFILLPALLLSGMTQARALTDNSRTQQLVDELKQLTDQAEQNRSASYRLIDQLRELSSRYDRPWGKRVLFDDFADGDFRKNPAWYTSSDDFWVTRSIGLRTELDRQASRSAAESPRSTQQPTPQEAIIGLLLGGAIQQENPVRRHATGSVRADISIGTTISNTFEITVKLTAMGRNNQGGSFEFGPYQGQHIESGYRLVYQAGNRPTLKLVSHRRNLLSVLELYNRGPLLADGNMHNINWQRTRNGMMTISLDGQQLFKVRDNSYKNRFSGFVMTNRGGDYGIRSISIFATGR